MTKDEAINSIKTQVITNNEYCDFACNFYQISYYCTLFDSHLAEEFGDPIRCEQCKALFKED